VRANHNPPTKKIKDGWRRVEPTMVVHTGETKKAHLPREQGEYLSCFADYRKKHQTSHQRTPRRGHTNCKTVIRGERWGTLDEGRETCARAKK